MAHLDLILSTRLELLEHVADEVDEIIDEMTKQRQRLSEVEDRIGPHGTLSISTNDLETALGDAENRLRVVLGHDDDAGWDDTSGLSHDNKKRLRDALEALSEGGRSALGRLREERRQAYDSFGDLQRWSIAGLGDEELQKAAQDYRDLLSDIKDSAEPWRRCQAELRGRGQELFTRYLELLGGMAVRGLDTRLADDARAVARLLVPPVPRIRGLPTRSPHVLMGTQHPPLGYAGWSLWALPLVGRTVAEHMIAQGNVFRTAVPAHLRVLCADLYSLYVLGPSYAHAALFLELQPDNPLPDTPPDSVRAQMLLQMLPQLDDSPPARSDLNEIADQLRDTWAEAREALGEQDDRLTEAEEDAVKEFFAELRSDFNEIAYQVKWLSDVRALGEKLVQGGSALDGVTVSLKDLLTAIWLARLQCPGAARDIHRRAEQLPRRGQMAAKPSDPKGLARRPRLGLP